MTNEKYQNYSLEADKARVEEAIKTFNSQIRFASELGIIDIDHLVVWHSKSSTPNSPRLHVMVYLKSDIEFRSQVINLQSMLGSDLKRSAFDVFRALSRVEGYSRLFKPKDRPEVRIPWSGSNFHAMASLRTIKEDIISPQRIPF
jgi:hypothetical protein